MTFRPSNVGTTQPRAAAHDYPWRRPPDAPPPVFATGHFLDGLPERGPDNRHTCCEAFCSLFGFEGSALAVLEGRYDFLMELCRRLPRSVPGNAALEDRLYRLRVEVGRVKLDTVEPEQRIEELDRLKRLCRTATRLHGELSTQAYIQLQQHRARQVPAGSLAASASFGTLSPASARSDSSSGSGADITAPEAVPEPLRQRTVRRRDRSPPPVAAMVTLDRLRMPSPYQLNPLVRETLQDAVHQARSQVRDGGRLSGSGMLELGRTVAQLVNGRFPVLPSSNADLNERQYHIGDTITAATRHMRPDQRDAIRAAAELAVRHPRP